MAEKYFKHDDHTYRVGDEVQCKVAWKNGREVWMRGKLIAIAAGEVFIETELGPVSGNLDTLEPL